MLTISLADAQIRQDFRKLGREFRGERCRADYAEVAVGEVILLGGRVLKVTNSTLTNRTTWGGTKLLGSIEFMLHVWANYLLKVSNAVFDNALEHVHKVEFGYNYEGQTSENVEMGLRYL
jgi:hypothetical protein